ncbi:DMT family transporter [Chitinimonas taiwanensis]|uniref:Threonine/homoserine efflux transporter RhtA n=1 Tax=Chitinimonas taiwanensis DSM 18899 TaxID=1121279 RepID=A0A1K2HBR9_9NEIS|nr:DMT family transporter [Chitinimonas taiwanensis]SFZ74260.1 Threonine/homoserine efflux transporter RhtA [Chitinimonas taiwanensis DSM 18899]
MSDSKPIAPLYLKLVLTMAIWGGTFIVGRVLAQALPAMSIAFWRFVAATLCLFLLLWRSPEGLRWPTRSQWLWATALGLSGVFAYNLFFFFGLAQIPASRAALLVALNPIMVAVVSSLLLGQALGRRRWLGVLCSLFGAVTVISHGDYASILREGIGQGELLILGCCVSWVIYTLFGRSAMHHFSSLAATAWAAMIGCALLGLAAAWRGELNSPLALDASQWAGVFYLGGLGTAAAFVWYSDGIKAVGAAKTIVFTNLVPVFAVLSSIVLLGEALSLPALLGGAAVVGGVWLTNSR